MYSNCAITSVKPVIIYFKRYSQFLMKWHNWNLPPPLLKGGGRAFQKFSQLGGVGEGTKLFARKRGYN